MHIGMEPGPGRPGQQYAGAQHGSIPVGSTTHVEPVGTHIPVELSVPGTASVPIAPESVPDMDESTPGDESLPLASVPFASVDVALSPGAASVPLLASVPVGSMQVFDCGSHT